jgi:hypothetical protein
MAIFEGFSELPEAQAVAIQTALTQVAKTVEDTADKDKKEAAALAMAYDALDLLIGAPGPVDYIAKQIVIPNLPAFFRWISEQLHELGVFGPHGQ